MSVVYLLHFERPYHHARHYLGSTHDLETRLQQHRTGQGATLMRVITQAGIPWTVARVWQGNRTLERAFKLRKNAPRLCPLCVQARFAPVPPVCTSTLCPCAA